MARGTVVQVRPSDAVVATAESGPQGPIVQRGDIVRVVQNGTRADVRAAVFKQQAWQTLLDYGMTGLLALLIVIGR